MEVVAPQIGEFYERDEFPTADRAADGRARPVRPALPGGVRRLGRRLLPPVRRPGGAGPGRQLGGDHAGGRRLAGRHADLPVRHRGAEAGVAAAAVLRRGAGRVRAHRARRRLGRRRDADDRAARGRPVGDQRLEGVHHQLGHRPHRAGHRHRGDRHEARTAARRSRRSSCRRARRASPSGSGTPRSAGTPPTPASCRSPTAGCPRRTWWASGAAATRSSCRSSTRAGSRSPRSPSGWRRAASTSR